MEKKNTTKWPSASHPHYIGELRKQGASDAYIKKELAAIEKEKATAEAGFYQGDNLEVIKTK